MREIKFKGKSAYNGEWVYGDLGETEQGTVILPKNVFDEYVFVEQNTISKFTGLIDSRNREVYEGDIIKHEDSSQLYVIFFNIVNMRLRCCPIEKFTGYHTNKTMRNSHAFTKKMRGGNWYVIDNIFDNHELKKEE